jgi:hypothetical protein
MHEMQRLQQNINEVRCWLHQALLREKESDVIRFCEIPLRWLGDHLPTLFYFYCWRLSRS